MAFKDGLNKAKALVEGNSPPIAGPFKDIDQWGFNVGTAWVDGVRKAIGDMSIGSPLPFIVSNFIPPLHLTRYCCNSGIKLETMNWEPFFFVDDFTAATHYIKPIRILFRRRKLDLSE